MNLKQKIAGLTALLGSVTLLFSAETDLTVVAVTGDLAPDGSGRFSTFLEPTINNAGQVAFRAGLNSTSGGGNDNRGVFRADNTGVTQIARAGQAVPGGNGVLGSGDNIYFYPLINDVGQVAFWARFTGTSGGNNDNEGIFRGDGNTLTLIARKGEPVPTRLGSFVLYGGNGLPLTLNVLGQVAFWSPVNLGTGTEYGVFRSDGTNLVDFGQVNNSGSTFPVLNDSGQVAFEADVKVNNLNLDTIFRGDGTSTPIVMVQEGQMASDGIGPVSPSGILISINNAGHIAFSDFLSSVGGGLDGVYRSDGTTLTKIVRQGETAPDGNGKFGSPPGFGTSIGYPAMNLAGEVAFFARLVDTAGGENDNGGVFRGDGVTLTQIVRNGQAAPDGNGKFAFHELEFFLGAHPMLNATGQVAFGWNLTDTSGGDSDNQGIYLYDDSQGLIQVARKGEPLLGSTITGLGFVPRNASSDLTALNDQGQVAFRFFLNDGRQGIAIWSPPSAPEEERINTTFDVASGSLTISWPAALTGWVLETTTNPTDPESWEPVTILPVTVGEEFRVTLPTNDERRFFRLQQM